MRTVVAYVPDLMDRSKVAAALPRCEFVRSPAELAEAGRAEFGADDAGEVVVLLDLSRPGVLEALPALVGRRTIGFASHVDTELIRRAEAAGCDEVLPRSRFFGRLTQLLG